MPNPINRPTLVARQGLQAARIHHGVTQGQLTRGEAALARGLVAGAHNQIAEDRADGGRMTAREWRRDQLILDATSRAIHRGVHNDRTRP